MYPFHVLSELHSLCLRYVVYVGFFFFFKQKTAYEMRISDWSSDVCSSDLREAWGNFDGISEHWYDRAEQRPDAPPAAELLEFARAPSNQVRMKAEEWRIYHQRFPKMKDKGIFLSIDEYAYIGAPQNLKLSLAYSMVLQRSEEHTSE